MGNGKTDIHLSRRTTPGFLPAQEELCTMDHEPGIFEKFRHRHFSDLMYLAKGSRPDILFVTTSLAYYVTKWQHWHDVLLVQLFIYLDTVPDMTITGRTTPNDLDMLSIVACCDADHAGDPGTSRSTSGGIKMLAAGNTLFPLSWASNRQGRTAQSTAEAELVSFNDALRKQLLPLVTRVEALVGHEVRRLQLCDSTACLGVIRNGASVALDYVRKSQRISLAWLRDVVDEVNINTEYVGTADNPSDIMTKHLSQPRFFELLPTFGCSCERLNLNIIEPRDINWVLISLSGTSAREACV